MKRTLAIDNHSSFQFTVARAVIAGGILGAAHCLLSPNSGAVAEISALRGSWTWLSGGLGVALLGAAIAPPRTLGARLGLGLATLIGAAATGFGARYGWSNPSWAIAGSLVLSLALGAYLARGGLGLWRGLLTLLVGTTAAYFAQKVPTALRSLDFVLELPDTAAALLSGAGLGLVVGGAAITRHLVWRRPSVSEELRGLLPPADATDEVAKLVNQAVASFQQASECLDEHPQARTAAADLLKKIVRFGKRWQEIEAQARQSGRESLEQRRADLEQRRDKATDETVRTEYERALGALRGQIENLAEIDKSRERAIARLHHQVAIIERLRLAALRHRSASAAKLDEELQAVARDLTQAGQELDTAADALVEL